MMAVLDGDDTVLRQYSNLLSAWRHSSAYHAPAVMSRHPGQKLWVLPPRARA